MAFMKKDMEPILQKYAGFGYTIYYLYQKGKVALDEIQNIFLKLNPDIASLYLDKVISKMDLTDMEKALYEFQLEYPKEQCLKDYFAIESAKITLKNDVYETALNYIYTAKMLTKLQEVNTDLSDRKIISFYQMFLDNMVNETKQSVIQTSTNNNVMSKAR